MMISPLSTAGMSVSRSVQRVCPCRVWLSPVSGVPNNCWLEEISARRRSLCTRIQAVSSLQDWTDGHTQVGDASGQTGRRRCHNTTDVYNTWLGLVCDLCGTTHDNTTLISSCPATNCAFSKQPRKRCMILGQLRHYTMKSACHCLNDAQQHWADRREGDGEERR